MVNIKLKIKDKIGIHARPAAAVVNEVKKFPKVKSILKFQGKEIELNSILSLLSLGIRLNDEIEISVEGEKEQEALDSIVKVFKENKLI